MICLVMTAMTSTTACRRVTSPNIVCYRMKRSPISPTAAQTCCTPSPTSSFPCAAPAQLPSPPRTVDCAPNREWRDVLPHVSRKWVDNVPAHATPARRRVGHKVPVQVDLGHGAVVSDGEVKPSPQGWRRRHFGLYKIESRSRNRTERAGPVRCLSRKEKRYKPAVFAVRVVDMVESPAPRVPSLLLVRPRKPAPQIRFRRGSILCASRSIFRVFNIQLGEWVGGRGRHDSIARMVSGISPADRGCLPI